MKKENEQFTASVYIILVNWNNFSDTVECIDSLLIFPYEHRKIVLVDNASTDGSLRKIQDWLMERKFIDRITIIPLNHNIGFGGANNKGIQYSLENNADFILLLNNDTIVTDKFLRPMLKTALSDNKIGIVGGKIKFFYNKDRVWFSGGHIDFLRGAFYHREEDCTGQRESAFITGCLMLIPTSVLRKVGYFDENYFLNVEDIDLSCRVKDAGYKLVINCDSVIYHKISASIGGLYSLRNQYYFHRNRLYFFNSRLSGIKKYSFYIFQFFVAIPAWISIQVFHGRIGIVKTALKGCIDHLLGIRGKSTVV